jgi:hypothetical protein
MRSIQVLPLREEPRIQTSRSSRSAIENCGLPTDSGFPAVWASVVRPSGAPLLWRPAIFMPGLRCARSTAWPNGRIAG